MSSEYKNVEVKVKINERLTAALVDSGKLSQAVTKSSKTREVLQQAVKQFVLLDNVLLNTYQTLNLIDKTMERLSDQTVSIDVGLQSIEGVKTKLDSILKI
ncbi:uncharacterized protein LOC101235063 [Hydra vulgaris]|uniref:uncharacterized protein LOC101235063 n=1 Tax=Hydra vulgaris TaxID=6087 RepID=UPI0002B4CB93|nr:uncharacterized protein LOC101235063 [Hydra vulgaris]